MIEVLSSLSGSFFLTLFSFFLLFTFRILFIERIRFVFLFHAILFSLLSLFCVGGGGAQSDGCERLKKFILLEKNNELEIAKNNPQNYDSPFQIDLAEFKNSNEFRDYLQKQAETLDKAEAIFAGWIFVLLTEISYLSVIFCRYVKRFVKRR